MHRILKHPPLSAPVDARHSSIRPPSRASCPEWALQTRASACSSLSRVTDEPPCAKRPQVSWGVFPLHVRGSYTVTLSWSCLLDPQLWVWMTAHVSYLPQSSCRAFRAALGFSTWRCLSYNSYDAVDLHFYGTKLPLKHDSGKMAAFITSWRTWRFSFSCGFRFPSLSSTDEVESSTLWQSGVDSVPFIQSQQR